MRRWAKFVVRRRWWVLAATLVILPLLAAIAAGTPGRLSVTEPSASGAESTRAAAAIAAAFPGGLRDMGRGAPHGTLPGQVTDDTEMALALARALIGRAEYDPEAAAAAESLREEIELLGPVKLKDVEAAQDVVIQAVRRLEEEGQIALDADSQALVA